MRFGAEKKKQQTKNSNKKDNESATAGHPYILEHPQIAVGGSNVYFFSGF